MSSDERTKSTTIGLADLALKLPALAMDVPSLGRGLAGLVLRKPTSSISLGLVFQREAERHPERDFVRFEGFSTTYGNANAKVNRYAAVLAEHGVGPGKVVGVMVKNRPEALLLALAVVKLGAAAGMLNHNQRGDALTHSVGLLNATVLVVGAECLEAFESLDGCDAEVLGLADGEDELAGHPDLDTLAKGKSAANPPECAKVKASAKAFYIFTSGTTGMPKASAMSHYRWLKSMAGIGGMGVRLSSSDTLYCCLPLYHNNALTVSLSSVLAGGATFAIGRAFSASRFWDDVIRNEATAFVYIGEICGYLLNQPPKAADRQHKVRVIVGNGMRPQIWHEFTKRFAIPRVAEFYGASECNVAFINVFNLERTAGACPLPYEVVEYDQDTGKPKRGNDGKLRKVPRGDVGLLLSKVTERAPFDGYTDEEASNAKLVHDGFKDGDCWFDTGDLVRRQGFQHVAFVDRLGDTFRWKGENVATTEVEGALTAHADIEDATVYGVEVPGTGGRAGMAAVTLTEGHDFDGKALARHLKDKLPSYAVPLFVRVVETLETTSTFKSRKVELRDQGYDLDKVDDPLYVLADGYVEAYPEYAEEVAAGKKP